MYADGSREIVGVSTAPVDEMQAQLLGVVVGGTAIGLVLVGVGGTVLIRRSLAPLDRVAATARRVSALKLDSGQVALAERVPAADADGHTEVGQVGLAINTMLDNVESALHARQESETQVRQFVADASHELRTPLASIRGYAELTRRETEPVPPTVTHAIGRVESEALRMQELVEDLLLLARLDSGRPLEREPVDLSLLAVNAVSDAHAAAPDHTWELDLPEDPVEVPGDQARLHQILANLLANARTHTPAGTHVVTRVRPEGSAGAGLGDRRRPRGARDVAAQDLRAVHPWRRRPRAGQRLDRARPEHRRGGGPGPRWPGRGVEPAGRDDLLGAPPRDLTPPRWGRWRRRPLRPNSVRGGGRRRRAGRRAPVTSRARAAG